MQTHCSFGASGGWGIGWLRPATPRTRVNPRIHSAGFTMVELMVVVGMMAIVAALAVRVMSRASRGERAPSFARSVLAMVHHARQVSLVSGKPTRIAIYASSSMSSISSERQQADGTWVKLDGAEPSAHGIDVCDAQGGRLTGTWPSTGLN